MMLKRASLLGLLVVFCLSSAAWAIPQMISFSGRLTNADGTTLADGIYPMTFSIWVEGEQSPRWGQGYSAEVKNGIVNLLLGDQPGNSIPLDIFENENVSLQINMQAGNTNPQDAMQPRQRLVSVPYAYRAAVADSVVGGGVGAWTVSGDNVYRETGNVGIGTTNPNLARLQAVGNRGVIGFNDDYASDYTGTYGMLGANLRLYPPNTMIAAGTYKVGVYGQADYDNFGFLGYHYKPDNQMFPTRAGVYGQGPGIGVWGVSDSGTGVSGRSTNGTGVYGEGATAGRFKGNVYVTDGNAGIGTTSLDGRLHVVGEQFTAIKAESTSGYGVLASSNSSNKAGVYGVGTAWNGVEGMTSAADKAGVYGWTGASDAWAGYFIGGKGLYASSAKIGTVGEGSNPTRYVPSIKTLVLERSAFAGADYVFFSDADMGTSANSKILSVTVWRAYVAADGEPYYRGGAALDNASPMLPIYWTWSRAAQPAYRLRIYRVGENAQVRVFVVYEE